MCTKLSFCNFCASMPHRSRASSADAEPTATTCHAKRQEPFTPLTCASTHDKPKLNRDNQRKSNITIKQGDPNTTTIGMVDGNGSRDTSNTNNVLRFTRKNRLSVLLEPNGIRVRTQYMAFMCTHWNELRWYTCIHIYSLYTWWCRCHKSWLPPHRGNGCYRLYRSAYSSSVRSIPVQSKERLRLF